VLLFVFLDCLEGFILGFIGKRQNPSMKQRAGHPPPSEQRFAKTHT
jgi:hypothetical protein